MSKITRKKRVKKINFKLGTSSKKKNATIPHGTARPEGISVAKSVSMAGSAPLAPSDVVLSSLMALGDSVVADISGQDLSELTLEVYKRMKGLNVRDNTLTRVPTEIGVMSHLRVFAAKGNKITSVDESIGKLAKLQVLELSKNRITTLPSSIENLSSLTKLYLDFNRLGTLPTSICNLSSLEELYLSHNFLLTVPSEISNLRSLEILNVSSNELKDIPAEMWKLENLRHLNLEHNKISKLPSTLKGGGANLRRLCLGYNKLKGQFPNFVFNLTSLEELTVSGNELEVVPGSIRKMRSSLRTLVLTSNQITDLPEDFGTLENLESLDLRGNPLGQLGFGVGKWKGVLVQLTSLRSLLTGAAPKEKIDVLIKERGEDDAGPMLSESQEAVATALKKHQTARVRVKGAKLRGGGARGQQSVAQKRLERNVSAGGTNDNVFDMFKAMSSPEDGGDSGASRGGGGGATSLDALSQAVADLSMDGLESGSTSSTANTLKNALLADLDSGDMSPRKASSSSIATTPRRAGAAPGEEVKLDRGENILAQFAACDEMNKNGLIRAKKDALQQEDAHCEHYPFSGSAEIGVFCVFDGHGGKDVSTKCTKLMPREIRSLLTNEEYMIDDDASKLLHVAFLNVDEKLKEYEYQGCTATVLLVWRYDGQRYVQSANVGDSAAFLAVGPEDALELTRDHKLADPEERDRMERSGVVLSEGATRIEGGLAVTRALGDHFSKDIDSGMIAVPHLSDVVELGDHHTHIVIASDGLWDVMSGTKALQMARKYHPKDGCKRIMRAALKNKECKDNICVTVIAL